MAAQAKAIEHEFVEIGLGLGRRDIFAAGEKTEAVEQAETREVAFAVGVRGIGREGDRESPGLGGVEECDHAREDGEGEVVEAVALAPGRFQGDPVGAFFKGVPRVKGVVGVADRAEKLSFVERHAVRGVDIGVGTNQGGLGIENEAVEVEDEGTDHGEETGRPVGRPSMLRWFFSVR